jgi:UDP:flavonoid glycosyltransferase YjiC (YdhE family)
MERRPIPRRILFTFAGGSGHLEPLIPLARAAEAERHTVAFAGRPLMTPQVDASGFVAFAAGSDAGLTPERLPLVKADLDQDMRDVGSGFGGRVARERAADILSLCTDWRPDLLVCEEFDFGAIVVAERLGVPHATVLVSATGAFVRPRLVAGPLDEVRAEHGLPGDPGLAMLSRYLVLTPFPSSLRDPALPLPATAHHVRLLATDTGRGEASPPWLARRGGVPRVYFTLGTVYNMESGDLFRRVLAGLRELPIDLIVTVGRDLDPDELGPQPANVRIERFMPQAALLPHCDLVVSHAGSGSVLGALAHGLPMVLIPIGADQPLNAARCEALGVAAVLDAVSATPETARAAVARVLADAGSREAAERIRDEIAALPWPEYAVTLLDRLASKRAPLCPESTERRAR